MSKFLIVDDDTGIVRTLQLHFQAEGHEVKTASCVDDGVAIATSFQPHIIVLDICMEEKSGLEGLPEFKAACPSSRIIMITAFHDMESTIQAMQRGADEYIHKPIDLDELDEAIEKALSYHASTEMEAIDIPEVFGQSMVGSSHAMKEIYKTIGRIAMTNASVLITGESGTGKEMVARAIHQAGNLANTRGDRPFVAVNCAALVETLFESELFGHQKGAFTGAVSNQKGKFILAQNGTLFLDEIGEVSPQTQAKLLRVLQEKECTPLGGKEPVKTNARIISATNINFEQAIKDHTFREDLFYRLQVVQIHIPPLRERPEDIKDLIKALLARANQDLGTKVNKVAKDAMNALCAYHWLGNVRELENVLTKAVALSPSNILTLDLFADTIATAVATDNTTEKVEPEEITTTAQSLEDIEQQHVVNVLKRVDGHKGKACNILKISRPRLQRILQKVEVEESF